MKFILIRQCVKEGLKSIIRHPLVTMASISTIALMLMMLGAFTVFSFNARHITIAAGQQPPVEIMMENNVTNQQLDGVEAALKADETVIEHQMYTPEQNFQKFKDSMENSDLFQDFPVENIPYTFTVRLLDPAQGEQFQVRMTGFPGVYKVKLELTVMSFLSDAIIWVNYATLLVFIILSVIAFFIISNMVRVAVFARGEEISIMKYVGATNWYIRVPYIIEGALVGIAGAIVAWLITLLTYDAIYGALMAGISKTDFLTMVPLTEISLIVLLINLAIGAGVGSLGSAVAVRRHIHV